MTGNCKQDSYNFFSLESNFAMLTMKRKYEQDLNGRPLNSLNNRFMLVSYMNQDFLFGIQIYFPASRS
jgi:hypothetical protein